MTRPITMLSARQCDTSVTRPGGPPRVTGRARELIEAPNFCHISTVGPGGAPHAALVWVDIDGDEILLNSDAGRVWPRNLRRDPRCHLIIANRSDPYELVAVAGRVLAETTVGADDHIEHLARKYLDVETYPLHVSGIRGADMVRVIFSIAPDRVVYRTGPGPRVD